jgi:hypothetical protein
VGIDIEIEVESEKPLTPEEQAAKDAEKEKELASLWAALKEIMDGRSGLSQDAAKLAKEQIVAKIADVMEGD